MAVLSIQNLLLKFGAGKSPRSQDYLDLIDTLADDRNAVYFSSTAPTDTEANPLWFNTSTDVLSVYDGEWITAGGAQGPEGPAGANGAQGPSGPTVSLDWISQQYYRTSNAFTESGCTLNQTTYAPIFIPSSMSLDRISFNTGNSHAGTSSVRLGIYANTDGKPSTLLLDAGTANGIGGNTFTSITINHTISTPGIYWLAMNMQSTPTTNSFKRTGTVTTPTPIINFPSLINGNSFIYQGYSQNSVTGAFSDADTLALSATVGVVWLRRA
jgi:hypothetical protein